MAMVSLESCYERARKAMAQGEHDRAEAVCRHIQQYYPQDLGTFQLLGQVNLERKLGREARDFFRRVLEIDPENVSAHWGMGIAYQDEGKLEQAIGEFEQALEIKPDLSDLRSQLLRLYTEMYGASQAQLRLSRAGLGRLYAKGGMLDKAIAEFREVLKLDPARVDVRASLLDAYWQGGNVDGAARVAEEILAGLPDALKANLILGYVRIAAGFRDAGEELWRKAAACDPNNTMARALLESAPTPPPPGLLAYDAATLPDFDEAAWQARRAAEAAQPQVAPPVTLPQPQAAPAPAPTAETPPPPASSFPAREPEPVGVSWLDALATGEGEVSEEPEAEQFAAGVGPFSLEGIDFGAGPLHEGPGGTAVGEAAAEIRLVEEGSRAGMRKEPQVPAAARQEPASAAPVTEPETSPFSLADLGLSAEEIASLEEAVATTRDGGTADIGGAGIPEEELLPDLAPFSLDDATLMGAEPALREVPPFSLEERAAPGLAPSRSSGRAASEGEGQEGAPARPEPFSLDELAAAAGGEAGELGAVEPFSIESLGLEGTGGYVPALGDELKPFSLEELGLDEPVIGEVQPTGLDRIGQGLPEDGEAGLPAFSWQEAGTSKAPAFRGELQPTEETSLSGPSLFEKMKASRRDNEPDEAVPPAAAVEVPAPLEAAAPEGIAPFTLEGLGLEEAPAAVPGTELPAEAESLAGLKPFSLESFGLEGPAAEEGLQPFSLADLGLEEEPVAPLGEPAGMAPFSLEELGLEEPASEVVAGVLPAEELPGEVPFSLEQLGIAGEPPVEEVSAAAPAEEVIKPFSLEELGLTPEEIAALSPEEIAAPAGPGEAPVPIVDEVLPSFLEEMTAEIEGAPAQVAERATAETEQLPVASLEEPPVTAIAELAATAVGEAPEGVAEEAPEGAAEQPAVLEAQPPVAAGASLEDLRQQWAARPADEDLLLSLARACVRQGQPEEAVTHYRKLLKTGPAGLADALATDLQDWIGQEQDSKRLYRLHRLLGDAYMKKGCYQQAINEYAWVLSK